MKVFSAWLALGFGTFLAVAEVVRNAGVVQWWPFWVVDYIAVGLLLWGAASVLWRPSARGLAILTGAWGFTCAMFYMSFFGHLEEMRLSGVPVEMANAQSPADEPMLSIIIGVLLALAAVGLVTSLLAELRADATAG